jgi:hypothetical protein
MTSQDDFMSRYSGPPPFGLFRAAGSGAGADRPPTGATRTGAH